MLEIGNGIYYTGVRVKKLDTFDFSVRDTYVNSYIVRGEKTALIDTVPEEYGEEFAQNIEKVMHRDKIDYLICNHTEQSHSGCVGMIIKKYPGIKVFSTIAGIKNLKAQLNEDFDENIAKDGAVTNLIGKTLRFMITPNLPWPDTMLTYCAEDRTLFSGDVFSSAYCGGDIMCIPDKNEHERAMREFFDVKIKSFKDFAKTAANRVSELDINRICTGMGAVLEGNGAVLKYGEWSKSKENISPKAAVIYASAYGGTREMAKTIAKELSKNGISAELIDCGKVRTDNLDDFDAFAFGSPTINRNAAFPVWEAVLRLNAVSDKGKACLVFGSYGWSGEAAVILYEHLKKLRLNMFEKPFTVSFRPSAEDKDNLRAYSKRFAQLLKNVQR